MQKAAAAGELSVSVGAEYPLAETAEAHRALEGGHPLEGLLRA